MPSNFPPQPEAGIHTKAELATVAVSTTDLKHCSPALSTTAKGRKISSFRSLTTLQPTTGSLKTPTATSPTTYLLISSTEISTSMSSTPLAPNTFRPLRSGPFSTIHGPKPQMLAVTSISSTTTRLAHGRRSDASLTIGTTITESIFTTMRVQVSRRIPKTTTQPTVPGWTSKGMPPGSFSNDIRSRSALNSVRMFGSSRRTTISSLITSTLTITVPQGSGHCMFRTSTPFARTWPSWWTFAATGISNLETH